jgi:MarR family transcriptional regulator, organic hydroperoxide resistance regulator
MVVVMTFVVPPDFLQLEKQVCFPLYAATRAMMQAYQPLLSTLGLTYPQYLVLLVLWERDGLAVKEIGRRLYLDSGTLTPLLKRMEEAGLLERVRSQKDERVVEIFLTAEGKKLKRKAQEVPGALACRLEMGPMELVRVRDELRRLFEHIRRVNEAHARAEADKKDGKESRVKEVSP